jgi:hypothetical protein
MFDTVKYHDNTISATSVSILDIFSYSSEEISMLFDETGEFEAHPMMLDLANEILEFKLGWYVPGSPLSKLWRYAVKNKRLLTEPMMQSIVESQTHNVRLIPSWLRKSFGSTKLQSFIIRGIVAERIFSRLGIKFQNTVIETNGDIIGYVSSRKRKMKLDVSGHLLDLLLASQYGIIDIRRYMRTVFGNVTFVYGNPDFPNFSSDLKKKASKGFIAEDGARRRLWHTYNDYYVAIVTAKAMRDAMCLDLDDTIFEIALVELNRVNGFVKKKDQFKWRRMPVQYVVMTVEDTDLKSINTILNFQKRM